jgi:hypothetical protein
MEDVWIKQPNFKQQGNFLKLLLTGLIKSSWLNYKYPIYFFLDFYPSRKKKKGICIFSAKMSNFPLLSRWR